MAIELIQKAIRLTSEDNTNVCAIVRQPDGTEITSGAMKLVVPDLGISVDGIYENGVWNFDIPKRAAYRGRHMYHFEWDGVYLDFQQPIYFV